ncbi:hypothetical protein QMK50_25565 [Pseudomonas sp. P5_152]|uniref:hypothetical protein n=1 Tax=Pseudomonas sp. P5_152 TaxID=3043442 RepID=UPI002A35C5D6|nr:hypothetical protein [Pseudomonas sp. P5_152]MDX9668319.1 hypothetical protein [Pseudomonas sp. P5_152]
MSIAITQTKLHWNYFLALERDMDVLSRYIEFCEANLSVFSLELAHLLFAAASEVDVVAKLVCAQISPDAARGNINHYRTALLQALPDLPATEVFVPRYGLSFRPWSNWADGQNPLWWRSYNNVKHQRDTCFYEATLKNALNALGALLVLVMHHYSRNLSLSGEVLSTRDTTQLLLPESTLFRLAEENYYSNLIV